jgi:UDP-N-acetylmuramate: L-alanyl-gamma-D-glutamyl-meso-diaminopimelate ligase
VAFRRFVNLVPRRGLLLLCADDREAMALAANARCPVQTFGLADGATWQAHGLRVEGTATHFSLRHEGAPAGSFRVPLLGAHNVRNAVAALAVGASSGLDLESMAEALRTFQGVRRRLELRGTADGVSVYDDFAHHPTAIAETLNGLRSAYPDRRIWAIFEPRSATSCRKVFQADFARSFAKADVVILPPVFRSTLPDDQRLSAEQVVADVRAAGKDGRYLPDVETIVRTVAAEAAPGDLVIVMSNGGFDNIHQRLLAALGQRAGG